MASIYQFTISKFVERNLSPDKRTAPNINLLTAFLSPIQWVQKFMFRFIYGALSDLSWNNVTSYSFATFVNFQNKIYVKWTYGSSLTLQPSTDTLNWYKVMDGIYGVDVKKNWNSGKLCLELILNNYFGTTFRQPVFGNPSVRSDIFISRPDRGDKYFKVYDSSIGTGVYDGSTLNSSVGVFDGAAITVQNSGFVINVPSAKWASIDLSGSSQQVGIVKSVIQDYVYAGILYNAVQY